VRLVQNEAMAFVCLYAIKKCNMIEMPGRRKSAEFLPFCFSKF